MRVKVKMLIIIGIVKNSIDSMSENVHSKLMMYAIMTQNRFHFLFLHPNRGVKKFLFWHKKEINPRKHWI